MNQFSQIIVVDDDPLNNFICVTCIRLHTPDANIIDFTSSQEAWQFIQDNFTEGTTGPRILLLLDVNMPVLSGWEFLDLFVTLDETIRSRFSVFMLTSSLDQLDRRMSEANTLVKGFMVKPLTHQQLEEMRR